MTYEVNNTYSSGKRKQYSLENYSTTNSHGIITWNICVQNHPDKYISCTYFQKGQTMHKGHSGFVYFHSLL